LICETIENVMTAVNGSNPLATMLNNAFTRFDRDRDGKLNHEEFNAFNEILKPGIAVSEDGEPTVDYSQAMDRDADKMITQEEMNSTGVLMPARLTDDSLEAILNHLLLDGGKSALAAAALLKTGAEGEG
jgi:Ca2+-binding EF-hand superfamily protein